MILNFYTRDAKIKTRKLRNSGLSTGTLKLKSGEIIPVSVSNHDLNTYYGRYGLKENMLIKFNGDDITVNVKETLKHLINHDIINIDLFEV